MSINIKKNHKVHMYERVPRTNLKKEIIYRCILPGCSHWIRQSLLFNRKAICPRCNHVFIVSKAMSKLKKPHCEDCTKTQHVRIKESEIEIFHQSQDDIDREMDELI